MPTDTAAMRPLHIQVPTDLHDRLRDMATDRDRSVAAETRRAIEERLDRYNAEKDGAAA